MAQFVHEGGLKLLGGDAIPATQRYVEVVAGHLAAAGAGGGGVLHVGGEGVVEKQPLGGQGGGVVPHAAEVDRLHQFKGGVVRVVADSVGARVAPHLRARPVQIVSVGQRFIHDHVEVDACAVRVVRIGDTVLQRIVVDCIVAGAEGLVLVHGRVVGGGVSGDGPAIAVVGVKVVEGAVVHAVAAGGDAVLVRVDVVHGRVGEGLDHAAVRVI